jgi:hypothetical protein
MERESAPVRPPTTFQEAVGRETVGELDRRRLGDTQHGGQRLHRVAGIGVEVHQRRRVGTGAAEGALDAVAEAVGGAERQDAEELGEAIGHA